MLQFFHTSKLPTSKQKLIDKLKIMPKDSAQQQTKHLIEVVKPLRLIEDANKDELKPQEAAIEIFCDKVKPEIIKIFSTFHYPLHNTGNYRLQTVCVG